MVAPAMRLRSVKPVTAIVWLSGVLLVVSALTLLAWFVLGEQWLVTLAVLLVSTSALVAGLPLVAVAIGYLLGSLYRRLQSCVRSKERLKDE